MLNRCKEKYRLKLKKRYTHDIFSQAHFVLMRRWQSGQMQQAVNLPGLALRWFKSNPAHKNK